MPPFLYYDKFWNQSVSWWTPVNQVTSSYQIRHKNPLFDCSHDQFPSTIWSRTSDFFQVSYLVRVPQLSGTYLHFPPFLQGLLVAVHSPFSPWYWHRSPSNKSFLVGANLGWEQLQKKSLKEQKKIVNHKGLTWEEGFVMHIFLGGCNAMTYPTWPVVWLRFRKHWPLKLQRVSVQTSRLCCLFGKSS